jgi:hypothetical protein
MGRMKNTNIAKLQLHMAKKFFPNLPQQFSIFRFKKFIEEEYYHMDDENMNLEIASTLAFEQFSKMFKEGVEKVGIFYIDFWNAFVQDDMSKISFFIFLNFYLNFLRYGKTKKYRI